MENNNNGKTILDTVMDAQKNLVDTVVSNTKKLANGNTLVNETVDKSSEWYKNWLETQKTNLTKTTEKATEATTQAKASATDMNEFYQNWYNQQTAWAKQMWDMNQSWMKNMQTQQTGTTNPMDYMQNAMGNMTSWMQGAAASNNFTNWMSSFQQQNPFNMDSMKNMGANFSNLFNQWNQMATTTLNNFQEGFQNGTMADTYRNMLNSTEGFSRFSQLWAPMMEGMQNKTFNMDMFKQWMNPAAYQELMDKYFGFLPAQSREHLQQMTTAMQTWMKQNGGMAMNQYQQMRTQMQNMMPASMGHDFFAQVMSTYENGYNQMQQAINPMLRMMTQNDKTRKMMEWSDIAHRMAIFNIKNAELQHRIYAQGTNVMDELASNMMTKMQNGEEVTSMMALYQEWLNISDKTFVKLFESDEYSQLMAEVSALQMKLRKDVEHQMEGMLSNIPVATRSEMDEMYKTIYDLKKQIRQLEKMMEFDNDTEATEATATNDMPNVTAKNNGNRKK